jgi:SAM-dependent methyltransferase
MSEFTSAGATILECCQLGALHPDDRFLDVGSGVGRAAIPLIPYLSPAGHYTGVDFWPEGVDWCTKVITPRHPNFQFLHLDLKHEEFNPRGHAPIETARLPFDDEAFDFAMVGSINHLTGPELEAFVTQAGRVLRSGGTYVGTWFLVDQANRDVLPGPAATVASEERVMRRILEEASLELVALHPGSWRAGSGALTYQDVVIARKVRA